MLEEVENETRVCMKINVFLLEVFTSTGQTLSASTVLCKMSMSVLMHLPSGRPIPRVLIRGNLMLACLFARLR
jgi:hypothetical protein